MQHESTLSPRTPAGAEHGFSLVEVLIAAGLLLIVTVGILPMFTTSITNNIQGKQSTETTNLARSELERLIQLPFAAPELTLATGATELLRTEKWSQTSKQWYAVGSFPAGEIDQYDREVRVRQFLVTALDDGILDPATELLPGAATGGAEVKEIQVQVSAPASGMSPGKQVTLIAYKTL